MKSYAAFKFGGKDAVMEKKRWADVLKARGVNRTPTKPATVSATAGLGTVHLTWTPSDPSETIKGWRIYEGDEKHLVATIRDPKLTQITFTPADSKTRNYFISAVNVRERESPKMRVQGRML